MDLVRCCAGTSIRVVPSVSSVNMRYREKGKIIYISSAMEKMNVEDLSSTSGVYASKK